MIYLFVRHTVADYIKWRRHFDSDLTRRKERGATGIEYVYRDVENQNVITLVMEWEGMEKARMFLADPKLEELMKASGVIGEPEVRFLKHT
jgi:hypothetical protein